MNKVDQVIFVIILYDWASEKLIDFKIIRFITNYFKCYLSFLVKEVQFNYSH